MRIVVIAAAAAAAGLIAVGALGVATAEAPTSAPPRTVSVQGVATESIDRAASAQAATAVYHQGMLDAVSDAQTKAQLLAGRVGATLGPVQSLVEDGGFITCSNPGESTYSEYEGAQPDFGSPQLPAGVSISAGAAAPGAAPGPRRPAVKRSAPRKRHVARKASSVTCTLSARVSLAYAIG